MATISLSPTSIVAYDTGTITITVTGSGTAFNGSSISLSGGYGVVRNTQSASSGTSAIFTCYSGAPDLGAIIVTDTLSAATANLTVNPPNLGTLNIGFIGDSITAGTNGNPIFQVGEEAFSTYMQNQGYTVNYIDVAASGSDTSQWLPGSANMNNALSGMAGAGIGPGSFVHVMLGTNDVRTPNSFTPAQHFANMQQIVGTLVGAGYKVIISKPIYAEPNAGLGAGTTVWPNNCQPLYRQYFALDMTMADGVNVFQGDTANFSETMQNPKTLLASDGVHPFDGDANAKIGRNWAIAVMNMFGNACPNMAISLARNSIMVMP